MCDDKQEPAVPPIQSKQDVLLESLSKFYAADPRNLRVLTDVLHSAVGSPAARTSLRILDWLVTNYAKKKNIVYLISPPDGHDPPATFNMFLEYKSQLKAYSKRFFDPFCRRERLEFRDADGLPFHTTVGQLNFFRWALLHGVVDFGASHAASIEDDMLSSIRHRSSADPVPSGVGKPKRRELSRAAVSRGCTKTRVAVTLMFR